MVSCNFCSGKSEKDYLYLTCNHFACLSCAFLRTDFATQEIACCDRVTRIDESSMETIIRSKRYMKCFEPSNDKFKYREQSKPVESVLKQELKIENKEEKCREMPFDRSKLIQKKSSEQTVSYIYELQKENDQADDAEVENVLMRELENSKRYFDAQREEIKQKEETAIRQIISFYETERKSMQKPITPATLQKLTLALSQKTKRLTVSDEQLKESKGREMKDSREQDYDHILKRLEVNQQRMKEKMQKHISGSY